MKLGAPISSTRRHRLGNGFLPRALGLALLASLSSAPFAQDIGFEGPTFPPSMTPTESKPQSKLWFNDGAWWGALWSSSASAFRIHRHSFTTHAWTDSGVLIEARSGSHSDALWDGTKLFIASHQFSTTGATGNPILIFRYSYNTTTDTYTLDAGFPVQIGNFSTESLTIAKDSTGTLWAAWTQGNRVFTNNTTSATHTAWASVSGTNLPTNTTNLNADDLCAMTDYGGNRIGIAWSDQVVNAYRFSFHIDGQANNVWSTVENISSGETDDHINLATHSDGRVYLAGKNAANNLLCYVRSTAGSWSRFVVTQPSPILTRPCIILNETAATPSIHIFATGQDTGEVFQKTSPISSINFGTGTGTIVMRDASAIFRISNPTSSKLNWTSGTGLVVLAHHDTTGRYWHHEVAPTGSAPVANFTATPTTGVAPLNVAFTDASTGSITSRAWNFGDGGTSTATSPSHNYTVPGTYTVTLTVTGPGGSDSEVKTNFITVATPPPVANFTATPTTGVAPLNVAFTDASTGSITSRAWNFGDGGTSTATSPSHNYTVPGTYTVTLTVTGPGGSDSEVKTNFITVATPPPVANFTATPTTGVAPLDVAFTDASTGSITSRAWNFGDGGTSTATSPVHNYTVPGTYTVTLTVTGPGGSDSEIKTNFITVATPPPVANFTATPTTGVAPLNVAFTDASTGSITSRAWNFGDGGTSTATSPTHNYTVPGTYTVTLTATGPGGSDSEVKTDFIVVATPPPVANFTATPTTGVAPLNVAFTDTSTGSITSRAWDFGDGGTSTATSPSHNYTVPGTYTVTLTVTGPGGSDSEVKTDFIVVATPPPVSNFTATPTTGVAPLDVAFTDASTGSITSRSWNFGDGGTSTATSPSHNYTTPGTYTVTLTVTGPGGSDSEVKTDFIVVATPPPVANFTATPTTGVAPLDVAFTDASTGSITSRAWSFGDGGTSNATSPSHTYTAAGTYTVTLTVTGPGGSDSEVKTDLIVASLPPPPVADFSATPLGGEEPLLVAFTDASTGAITSRAWDFGDGGTSTATSPSHTYTAAGTYTVTLTVTGPGGSDSEVKTDLIVVTPIPAPVADFTATPLTGQEPLQVDFTDLSTGAITSRAWDFGDGGTSTATNPSHTYVTAGTYTVSLTVTGPGGSDTETKTDLFEVTSIPPPVADFSANPLTGQEPLQVDFTDLSTGIITSRAWDFGDGGTSTAASPSHTYANDGTYTVTLTVTGPGGSDSEIKTDLIVVTPIPAPVADFSASPLTGQEPLQVDFTDLSTGNITSRSWNFGDGDTSSATSPSHTYANDGTYTVTLTVTGPGGSDSEVKTDLIVVTPIPPPVADFSASPLGGQEPLQVDFTDLSTGSITSRAWEFGDGGTSTAASPSHTYANDGTYTVTLTVTGPGGSDSEVKTDLIVVTPIPAPVADFSASPLTGQEPLQVDFTDLSTGNITSRAWDFGDGGTSSATSPSHTYANDGTYTVTLTVTGPGGSDSEIKTDLIVVTPIPAPVADFSATPLGGQEPLQVDFTDLSTGNITSRAWDFGDGGTSSATNPSHTYANDGTYTVTLTVTGPGGSDSEIKTDLIVVTPIPPPVADFSATPLSGEEPLLVSFTDLSTGNITSRAWNFGDGGTSSATSPSHTYANDGTYTVTLTVTGPGGSDSEVKTDLIVVTPIPPPVADFSATPLSGEEPLLVSFTDLSTGNITSRSWNFGDGGTSSATSPSHTYANDGTYTVTLTVTGPGGSDSEVKTDLIVVTPIPPPVADFSATPLSGEEPLLVSFTDLSTGNITSRSWNFGDGGTSSATSPSHTYANDGTYTVTLTVTGPGGSDSEIKTDLIVVTPTPAPVADFTANPTTGTAPLLVTFTNASTGAITSRSWNFGDGGTSTAVSPTHTYTAGTYTVTLTVTGPGGSDSEIKTNLIVVSGTAAPVANFTANPTTGTAPLNVAFTNTSTGDITSRSWNFGDGGTSTSSNPSHTYAAGTYTVTLTVTGPGGNDSEVKTNLIVVSPTPAPVANFTADATTGTAPLEVDFTNTSTGNITSRSWNFGDGGTSSSSNPSHTYTAAGTYTVTLTVTGPGGSDSEVKTGFIVVSPVTNNLVLGQPTPGAAGTSNSITVTGATPGSVVGFYMGRTLGSSVVTRPNCPLGITLGIARPWSLIGTRRANSSGVATLVTNVPASMAGKTFNFQAVDQVACSASNLVTERF